MKRKPSESSSFDLFLDTVCNAFGGIVFLAILLALLIQTRQVVKSDDPTPQQPTSADEMRKLVSQLDDLTAKHATLAVTLDEIPDPVSESLGGEFEVLTNQIDEIEQQLKELSRENTRAVGKLSEQIKANETQKSNAISSSETLAQAKQKLIEMETQYVQAVQSKQQTLTLPRTRDSNAASILVLLDGGMVYLAHEPALYDVGFNTDHVTTRDLSNGQIEIRPVPGAGWRIDEPNGMSKVRSLISKTSRSGNIITLAIWPSDYGSFTEIREEMIRSGVPYQLWVQDENEVLSVSLGSGAARIQ
ncbi:MAG TPA: hypothetical protein DDZ51_14905 [Planctomycetaceae bacterium]|nr:hypothetical protein [Planctomycetaceae bacterium]